MAHILIPKEISADEPCVRCIVPGKMRNERILPDAILPREGRDDASLLRLNYTSLDFCVAHGRTLDPQNRFGALVKFTPSVVDAVNKWASTPEAEVEDQQSKTKSACGVGAHVAYTPMDNGVYVDTTPDYYTDSPITHPMHADLIFHEPLEKGLVRIRMRKYVNELIKRAQKAIMVDNILGEWK